jgi:hypothetical protein
VTADLASWLLADDGPIAEDERVANAALARTRRWPKGDAPWEHAALRASLDPGPAGVLDRMATFGDPARVLAECAAKRAVVKLHGERGYHHVPPDFRTAPTGCAVCVEWRDDSTGESSGPWPCPTLLAIARPYAGRPGWREEWASGAG